MQQAKRVGFVYAVSVALRFDVVLVKSAAGYTRNKAFPDA